jgi:hypothetical protein
MVGAPCSSTLFIDRAVTEPAQRITKQTKFARIFIVMDEIPTDRYFTSKLSMRYPKSDLGCAGFPDGTKVSARRQRPARLRNRRTAARCLPFLVRLCCGRRNGYRGGSRWTRTASGGGRDRFFAHPELIPFRVFFFSFYAVGSRQFVSVSS